MSTVFDPLVAPAGRGLRDMHLRAAALGGELRIERGSPGTIVELWLPGPRADAKTHGPE